jgi:EmrB/QacA subfamily drug resistance transporter
MAQLSTLEPRAVSALDYIERRPSRLRDRLTSPSTLLFVILTAQMMVVLDATIVNVALPHIQSALHFSTAGLSWVLNAYIIAFGGLLLLGARSGDLLGRRRTFLMGIGLFSLSSLAGGFAASGWMLLMARTMQGVGAALAAPASLALLTTAFPDGAQRVRAIGLYTTVSAAGGATGLVAGGLLTEWTSWRWVMFVNVPIGLAVWLVGRVALVETPRRTGRFDFAGAVASTAGTTGVVLGLVQAGPHGWTSASTLVPLAFGATLLAMFFHIESRAEEPILPLRLLANPTRSAANLARGLVYCGMYGMFFFLTQFLQEIQHYSPIKAGIGFLPIPVSVFLSSQLTSKVLVGRIPPKLLMLSGITLSASSLLLSSHMHAGVSYPQVLVGLVLLGSGAGISLVSLTSASLTGVDPADAGAASGLVNVVQQIGAAFGLAVLVTVFGSTAGSAHLGPSARGALSAQSQTLIVHGLDNAFTAGAVFALVALAIVAIVVRAAGEPESSRDAAVEQCAALEADA